MEAIANSVITGMCVVQVNKPAKHIGYSCVYAPLFPSVEAF